MDYAAAIRDRLPAAWRGSDFSSLLSDLETYLSPADIEGVVAAYEFSAKAHEGQQRLSGEAYISHPVAVAKILAGLHLDAGSIKAALLHDVVEDTPATLHDIEVEFGDDVALLVDGVSKLDRLRFDSALEAQAESFRKMLLAMVKDLRVILVKLADRTHNMRTIDALSSAKRRAIAKETLDIYAPIANRLGIYGIKTELEDLGFKTFAPFRYRVLERAVRKARGGRQQFLNKLQTNISRNLATNGIEARMMAREKHLYSIYSKMRRKKIPLSDIADFNGLRIIVGDIDTCYRVLGLIHQLYKPMPGRFKDYIAIPRVNGYQSLHTTLFGPNGVPLEVQIRTEDMDRLAERGIAAHWQYKAVDKHTYSAEARAREWLTGLIEMQEAANSEEFLETVKVDLFPDKVYVFTPKGDIMRLPSGATAVDFAYAVHTDVGNRCVAAKIDGRLVPLKSALSNGDTVEILTARGAKPNPNWVNFVTTAKARNAIRAYLKNLTRDEARTLGRRLLEQALRPFDLSNRKLRKRWIEKVLHELGENELDRVYEQLGLGERLAPVVAALLAQQQGGDQDQAKRERKPLEIAGTEGLVVGYARCCNPIPGDEIIGFLSSGLGVVIHRTSCPNVADFRKHPTKWIPVDWQRGIKGEFQSEIQVRTMNRVGLLAEVAGRISATKSNIDHVNVETDGDASTLQFRLKVRDRGHLAQVLRSIRTNPDVLKVQRLTG
ncbi:MAG: bifunctional (p)ppGpp synthetase/guanosine-3',5'-bis(diphosphate) 3'-pyrophosphohydrolase [Gammaproteobacteria bacterium]|nr:bifunctional (p)ppGpp synthetase/guanosine-3',5'-bis(diphosphate) 3'-pyrophosphohydrolase [Gammaproteobacteria bacterium]MDH3506127.1 bifunctional (p)ppGpp synthetase/guanosine-3',5'-bis(diphosphate) 3'-pyrophosphohydrolase [Gammaproteobacteria bacterium]